MKKTVVIGFLGSTLDAAKFNQQRWHKWRPTVSLCMQEDLRVDRLVLLHSDKHLRLMEFISKDIREVSPETTVDPHIINFDDPWDFEEVYTKLMDFARLASFDPDTEDYLIHITTGTHVGQICLFLLTEARFLPGKLLQSQPQRGQPSPIGKWNSIDLDLSRYDSIATRFADASQESASFLKSGIETRNAAFNQMIEEIEQVAIKSKAPILLMGPTGAGKSMLARKIYELKRLRHQVSGPFVEVNCATLKGDGAMSALFGHKKGAFTGAQQARAGLLQTANTGILFLDEIGELGLDEQAMILRAIEDGTFLPVGADKDVTSQFQLIGGTNRILQTEVAEGRFREDLFARLNLWTFELPGLADRREDIEPNLDFELERFAEREGTRVTMNTEARDRYLSFAKSAKARWKGNFRDLSASVTRLATLSETGRICTDAVDLEIKRLSRMWSGRAESASTEIQLSAFLTPAQIERIDPFDRVQLAFVLSVSSQSRSLSDAGRCLFSASRERRKSANDADRLRKYLAKFDLEWSTIAQR